jgi:hypothetical protein
MSAISASKKIAVDKGKYYSVVLFDETRETATVLFVWLFVNQHDSQTYCCYPTAMKAFQLNRAVIDCMPPDDSWDTFQCHELYATGLLTKLVLSNYLLIRFLNLLELLTPAVY